MPEELYLVLGCYGRTQDRFVSCSAAENRILRLGEDLYQYQDLCAFLEGLRLYDRPLLDFNGVRNALFRIQDTFDQGPRRLWDEPKFHLLERFTLTHKPCGIYLKLQVGQEQELLPEEERIPIQGTPTPPTGSLVPPGPTPSGTPLTPRPSSSPLRLVRGRR